MLAQKQPPFKECVIAHWSRGPAPKIPGAEVRNRSYGCGVEPRGRGAFLLGRSRLVRDGGLAGSENVGMSSEKGGENPPHRKHKDSWATIVVPG